MDDRLKMSLYQSFLLHLSLILLLLFLSTNTGPKSKANASQETPIASKVQEVEVQIQKTKLNPETSPVHTPAPKPKPEKCKKTVFGIGVIYDSQTNIIQTIIPNSPAEKAGIEIGDVLLSGNLMSDKPGSVTFVLQLKNSNKQVELTLERVKLCIEQ